ncbi:MAG: hypothetical protein JW870_00525 [Candidatus Delongbacteria bacterium]|nr:hypothetical protein [Candidatus Delongbacteria bacterium]
MKKNRLNIIIILLLQILEVVLKEILVSKVIVGEEKRLDLKINFIMQSTDKLGDCLDNVGLEGDD